MSKIRQRYNDKFVLQFILSTINNGKKRGRTQGIDLIDSGLYNALTMLRPDVKNPLNWLEIFVRRGQLCARPTKTSFLVYDPENISDQVRKKCSMPVNIIFEGDTSSAGLLDLVRDMFGFSAAGNLCGGKMIFCIRLFSCPPCSTWTKTKIIIDADKGSDTNLSFFVHMIDAECYIDIPIPHNVNREDVHEALEHAKKMHDMTVAGRKISSYVKKRAESLYEIAQNLLSDNVSRNRHKKIDFSPVLRELYADLLKIESLKGQSRRALLQYEEKKEALIMNDWECKKALRDCRNIRQCFVAKIARAEKKYSNFPELLDLLYLFVYKI